MLKLTTELLSDFASAVIPQKDSAGTQTTRGTVMSVDTDDETQVTVKLDGSNTETSAKTTVECDPGDRVLMMVKNHAVTVIGNISNPVLKKVTAEKVEAGAIRANMIVASDGGICETQIAPDAITTEKIRAGAITTDKIEAHAITAEKITVDDIVGTNGWINMSEGTFAYGTDKLTWDGTTFSAKGTFEASGGKIGDWAIDDGNMKATVTDSTTHQSHTITLDAALGRITTSYPNLSYYATLSYDGLCASGTSGDTIITDYIKVSSPTTIPSADRTYSAIYHNRIYEDGTQLSSKYAPASQSDPRLKKNISNVKKNAIDILNKLPMHSFDWLYGSKHWDFGFLAPELYEIDENLAVKPDDEDTAYWTVNDFYLVGILTKALQELSAKVDALERSIDGKA